MTVVESPSKMILSKPSSAASSIARVAAKASISTMKLASWTFWVQEAIARPWLSRIITPRPALPTSWKLIASKLALYQSKGGGDHLTRVLTVGAAIVSFGCADRYSIRASNGRCTMRFRGKPGGVVLTLFLRTIHWTIKGRGPRILRSNWSRTLMTS